MSRIKEAQADVEDNGLDGGSFSKGCQFTA